jgi:hypothetical protein
MSRLAALLAAAGTALGAGLEWIDAAGHRRAPVATGSGAPGFTRLSSADIGLAFTNQLSDAAAARNSLLEDGGGVAAGDIDGDGWCDLYFCNKEGANALFRNLGGWRFTNVTALAGVACAGRASNGAVFADVDGDGDLDLLVGFMGAGASLFLNDGRGVFTDATAASGLAQQFAAHTFALADVDGDADLDLYVANYRTDTIKDADRATSRQLRVVNGKLQAPARFQDRFDLVKTAGGTALVERGEPSFLYLNDGRGRFTAAAWDDGRFRDEEGKALAGPYHDWSLAAMFRDLNQDGAPDLYVCNDFYSPDRVWLNDGRGNFRAAPRRALRQTSLFSMAVDFADLNRDGHDDFLVLDMLSRDHATRQTQRANFELEKFPWWGWPLDAGAPDSRWQVLRNTLFLNRGDGTYAEIAQAAGVHASEWSWSASFLDVDLDGFEDLLIANGHAHDVNNSDAVRAAEGADNAGGPGQISGSLLAFPPLPARNAAVRNRGDLSFADASAAWGFDELGVSHGLALADLDNDGDLDVALNNLNGAASLYRNHGAAPRVLVTLRGRGANTAGIGARVTVRGAMTQAQEIIAGGRYLSGDAAARCFAMGDATNRARIEVRWRSGRHTVISNAPANHIYEIIEPDGAPAATPKPTPPAPWFTDASALVKHAHRGEPSDEWTRQPLAPRALGHAGPGVAWFDVNADGRDDLVVGNGWKRPLRVLLNTPTNGFVVSRQEPLNQTAVADKTGLVLYSRTNGAVGLLVGLSDYTTTNSLPASLLQFLSRGSSFGITASPRDLPSGAGALAMADLDGDGALDLFVGGGVAPGRYPVGHPSRIYLRRGETFVWSAEAFPTHPGLVNGAVFTDFDGDGDPDLALACEWGPVRVFENRAGRLVDATESAGLAAFTGWWQGVTAVDLDGDGRQDLVASNWGRNSKYQEHLAAPLRLYHGDADQNGTYDVVEAVRPPSLNRYVALRDYRSVREAMPFVLERISGYRQFGETAVEAWLGEGLKRMRTLEVTTLDSMVFLNRGGRFEARPLPFEAQLAPGFGVAAADFNGDGHEDVFLAQNFFGVDRETGRYDAGRGVLLLGDGRGNLVAAPGPLADVPLEGACRGAAVADYDGDGRADLAVTQHHDFTRLLRNTAARPGVRVRLLGPPGNREAFGASVRLVYRDGTKGPARERHGGGGYWAQDGGMMVLGAAGAIEAVEVRWPDGRTATTPVATDQGLLEIRSDTGAASR